MTSADIAAPPAEQGCRSVVVRGRLDDAAAGELFAACDEVLRGSSRRLQLDLSGVTEYSSAGVAAIAQCLVVGRRLEGGIGVTVASDAGRRALLDSMTSV